MNQEGIPLVNAFGFPKLRVNRRILVPKYKPEKWVNTCHIIYGKKTRRGLGNVQAIILILNRRQCVLIEI